MARKLRLQYRGAIYHILNRGNRREDIFLDASDRVLFIKTLSETCAKTGWQVHAYCLMSNHFHLVIETPAANLVPGMKWFLGAYTARFNRRHQLVGHLFAGRYKSIPVDATTPGYLKTVCDYVHLNPVRAQLLKPGQPLNTYPWSSYPEYLKTPRRRWMHLRADRLLGEHGIPKDSAAGRKEFSRRMHARQNEDNTEAWSAIRRAWAVGDPQFRRELLHRIKPSASSAHYGAELQESAEQRAHRLIREELKQRKLKASKLPHLPKGHPAKLAIARRLRAETTVTVRWLAAALSMGSPGYLGRLLYEQARPVAQKE